MQIFYLLKEMLSRFHFRLNRKTSLALIFIFIGVIVFDSMIVTFSSYSGIEFLSTSNIIIFFTFSIIFIIGSAVLIYSVRSLRKNMQMSANRMGLKYFDWMISSTQIIIYLILVTIILQIIFQDKYSLTLLSAQTYFAHLAPLVFLFVLIYQFVGWFNVKRNKVIMLYGTSFMLVCVNLVISLLYLESYYSISSLPDVTPFPISSYVTNLGGLPLTASLSTISDILSLTSFLLMWIATAILLSQYRRKMGQIKYFILMSIPLIYYVFPFQYYYGDIFSSLLLSSPLAYSIAYVLVFSATKQVGALLFSLAFWTASTLVHDDLIRKLLLLSSIGIAILFGAIELVSLQYHVFPPYGLITEAFLPLGAYLVFVGIFASAGQISRNTELRREFYRTAASQLNLLKNIGVSQMEKELEKNVKFVEKRSKLLETEKEPPLEDEDVKEILREVLEELYSKNKLVDQDSSR